MKNITGGNTLLDVDFILKKTQIGDGMKIADLGCGILGHFVFPASRLVGKRGSVYAVDILKTILQTIDKKIKQDNIKNVQTVWSNLEVFNATKIEQGSLDVAFLINILYQSHKRVEIVREATRLLKKGGILLVVEWKKIASPFGPPLEERINLEALKFGAKKLGLKTENEFEAGKYHFGILFCKM